MIRYLLLGLISFACTHAPKLIDTNGGRRDPFAEKPSKAIVLVWQGNGCPIFRLGHPAVQALQKKYAPQVRFYFVNANPQDKLSDIKSEALEYGIETPILKDESQAFTRSLGVTRTMEAVILDASSKKMLYRGPVDDALDYEASKQVRHHYLDTAIADVLAGRAVTTTEAEVKGCLISL